MRKMTEKLVASFKRHLENEERSAATIEKYIRDVNAFALWLGKRELNKYAVLEYKEHITKSYAVASVNSMLSSINSFFACNEWYDLRVKAIKVQKQLFLNKEKELTKAEYERLLNASQAKRNKRLYYLMQTICSTGIRVSELKFITVEAVKRGRTTINCKGKMRVVFLPDKLCKLLCRYIKENGTHKGAVFVSRNGKPLDRSHIWQMLKGLCESAGVPKEKVFPHNFRHLFARTYYSLQKDVVRLADILGHSSVNTTRIYTMETGEVHRRQIQRLGLLRC